MAKKNSPKLQASAPDRDEESLVGDAYREAFKQRVDTFFREWILDQRKAEGEFAAGLAILRDARDRAMKII